MSKIITDEKAIFDVLNRGVEKIYPSREELEKKLKSGQRIRVYAGYDPSAKSLHVGNAISIAKLGQIQRLGHEVIFLIGGFTGMIGDPTDKKSARVKLSREDVLDNAKNFKEQASAYVSFEGDNPALVRYNNEWLDKLSFSDVIELASNFTVQRMITRDMFQKRLAEEKPIFLHEFLYPLAQAYDSFSLDVDLEIGGNDQMFNMLAGRDLQKTLSNKDKFVMTMKLLTDNTGKKMGKSEGNAFFLDQSADEIYGKVMSWGDGALDSAFEMCTDLPLEEVASLLGSNSNPRDSKMRLAYEITKINHGEESAQLAQDNFIKTVQNKEIPDDIIEVKVEFKEMNIVDLLVLLEMVSSKGEARRMIEQKAIKIGGRDDMQVINDSQANITITSNLIVQRGKRQFIQIITK